MSEDRKTKVLAVALNEARELDATTVVFFDTKDNDWRWIERNNSEHMAYMYQHAKPGTISYVSVDWVG